MTSNMIITKWHRILAIRLSRPYQPDWIYFMEYLEANKN